MAAKKKHLETLIEPKAKRLTQFTARMKRARLKAGYTQEELGWAIDMDFTAVCRLERGLIQPSLLVACKVAEALRVPLDYLVGRVKTMHLENDSYQKFELTWRKED